jgi:hypothetical protein
VTARFNVFISPSLLDLHRCRGSKHAVYAGHVRPKRLNSCHWLLVLGTSIDQARELAVVVDVMLAMVTIVTQLLRNLSAEM